MPVLREVATKHFWVSVLWTVLVALALLALGAWLVVMGVLPVEKSWLWVCGTWCIAALIGGRYAGVVGEEKLLRSLGNGAVALGLLWLLGLTAVGGDGAGRERWLWYAVAMLIGALLASTMPKSRRRRRKRQGRTPAVRK